MDELDVFRCAKLLVEFRGPQEAWRHAAQRAMEMKEDRDEAGHLVWVRIVRAVEVLTRTARLDGERLQ